MAEQVRILSVRQPWAWSIFHARRWIENRHWVPQTVVKYRGPVLISTGKTCTRRDYAGVVEMLQRMRADVGLGPVEVPPLDDLARGALVGACRIVRADVHPVEGVRVVRGRDGQVRPCDWARGYCGFRVSGALGLQLDDVTELPPIDITSVLKPGHLAAAFLASVKDGTRGLFSVPLAALPEAYAVAWRTLAQKSEVPPIIRPPGHERANATP